MTDLTDEELARVEAIYRDGGPGGHWVNAIPIARLISEVKRRRLEMGWLPIEGAPKGKPLLLYFPKEIVSSRTTLGEMYRVDLVGGTPRRPTRYMLLPAPPPGTGG